MGKPAIGFVGLGAMGFGMATHLVKQGYQVQGYDVFPVSVDRFKQAGGQAATTLGESAKDKEFYVCMVATAAQAQEVLFGKEGIAHSLPDKAIVLLCSTVPASYARSAASQFDSEYPDKGIELVDCPVSGGAKRAADGTLSIMAGAADETISRARFLLEEMSDTSEDKLYIVPGGVGAGSNMKMVHQVLAAIHVLGAGEAMGFAARLGMNAEQTFASIKNSDAWTWMFENRTPRMISEEWRPEVCASAATIILKDIVSIFDPTLILFILRRAFAHARVTTWLGNRNFDCTLALFPDPSLFDSGAGLPVHPLTGPGRLRRLGHGPAVLPNPGGKGRASSGRLGASLPARPRSHARCQPLCRG